MIELGCISKKAFLGVSNTSVWIGMGRNQYPFWKDREIAYERSEKWQYQRELEETKKKLKNVKCPKCGYVFDIE